MQDEIKEILRYLRIENGHCSSELSYEETHLLLDYINNLQNENEELRRFRYTIRKDETKTPPVITRTYKREYEEVQQRVDKAIEYINNSSINNWLYGTPDDDLLKILGGDE